MVISQMSGALFHDEYPKDNISTQFNPLGSLFKSPVPKLGGDVPQPLKIKI